MITLESIRNTKNHNYLIEKMRKKMTTLEQAHWNIQISWVKAHLGIMGNELADRLAKTAANDNDNEIIFSRLPIGPLINKIKEKTMQNWHKEWEECSKAEITKKVFPKDTRKTKVKDRNFPRIHSDGDGPWKNQSLPPPLQNIGKRKLPVWRGRPNCRPST